MHDAPHQTHGHPAPPVEQYMDGDAIIAIVIRASYTRPGPHFFSPAVFSQQLGVIEYPAGHRIEPHVHNLIAREVMHTQETLVIRKGRLSVDLYRDDRSPLATLELGCGDVILLASGGHGLTVLDDCSILEVKQGPYAGDRDKVRFEVAERDSGQ